MIHRSALFAGLLLLAVLPALAQQQPKPPPPYTPTAEERQALDDKEKTLGERLRSLQGKSTADAAVFLHTAELADRLRLYTNAGQIKTVLHGLDAGLERCESLAKGDAPWTTQPGRSLRGYVSRIDGSVQPYGVVLPAGFDPKSKTPMRLDVVLHGRGPTEVTFLQQMEPARNTPPDQPFIELHAFGRANNGWRWSGETDVFEALEQVRNRYPIDADRTILRGFSMGGHGAWQIGLHYPDLWAAVSPGAGFTDTQDYLKIQKPVPPYQEQAWHIYDAVDYALNLFDTPFVAYGGEKDPQLRASLNMKDAAAKEGLALNLIIGPNTAHAYEPNAFKEIMRQLATHTREARPKQLKFTTWTLRYNRCFWLTVDGLEQHYRRANVTAQANADSSTLKTENVTALSLDPPPPPPPPAGKKRKTLPPETWESVTVDGQQVGGRHGRTRLEKVGGQWRWARTVQFAPVLAKRHGLQGPIDDAFMDRFVVVRGTGQAWTPAAAAFADAELVRFQEEYRFGFRGELPLHDDTAVADSDWKDANLVLFGDPGSNRLLDRLVGRLPFRWTREGIRAAGKSYGPDCLPVLVYPNPLNPSRYVVINSGHTFTMKDLIASNAYLTPKLPDWAILKLGAAQPDPVAAGFFDEAWSLKP